MFSLMYIELYGTQLHIHTKYTKHTIHTRSKICIKLKTNFLMAYENSENKNGIKEYR